MILNLTKLGSSAAKFAGEDPIEVLTWEGAASDIVRPAGALRWDFSARLFDTELLVTGSASAEFEGFCARCGKHIKFTVSEPLSFSMEVGANDVEADLTPEIREAILLALPLNPLCRDDCPGLCPRCGMSLENNDCDCGQNTANNPFGGL